MLALTAPEITAYIIGVGTLLTGTAAFLSAKSESKKNTVEGSSIGETALANAVKVVEEVYDKVTGRMNVQIDELLQDNQKLRTDVGSLRREVATLTESNGSLISEVSLLTRTEAACRDEVVLLRAEVGELRAEKT